MHLGTRCTISPKRKNKSVWYQVRHKCQVSPRIKTPRSLPALASEEQPFLCRFLIVSYPFPTLSKLIIKGCQCLMNACCQLINNHGSITLFCGSSWAHLQIQSERSSPVCLKLHDSQTARGRANVTCWGIKTSLSVSLNNRFVVRSENVITDNRKAFHLWIYQVKPFWAEQLEADVL